MCTASLMILSVHVWVHSCASAVERSQSSRGPASSVIMLASTAALAAVVLMLKRLSAMADGGYPSKRLHCSNWGGSTHVFAAWVQQLGSV